MEAKSIIISSRGFVLDKDGKHEIGLSGGYIERGEWVTGSHIVMIHNDERTHSHSFIIKTGTDMSYGRLLEDCLTPVVQETVTPHTQYLDKEGKDIYGGDIVKICVDGFEDVETEVVNRIGGWYIEIEGEWCPLHFWSNLCLVVKTVWDITWVVEDEGWGFK